MSKRDISYIKPQDPKFLQALKHQIGYKEGPSVETKRQKLEDLKVDSNSDENSDREDEKPQIVVIKAGDLTAEEVATEETRLAKEAAEAPADLSKPIIFRRRHKPSNDLALQTVLFSAKSAKAVNSKSEKQSKSSGKTSSKSAVKLSFNIEEEEEQ